MELAVKTGSGDVCGVQTDVSMRSAEKNLTLHGQSNSISGRDLSLFAERVAEQLLTSTRATRTFFVSMRFAPLQRYIFAETGAARRSLTTSWSR